MARLVRTRVVGLLNTLPDNLFVFMWEYDKEDFDYVYEEMCFISEVFDIDIDILESSEGNYHVVSYYILSYDKILSIHRWLTCSHEHYLDINEIELYRNIPKGIQRGNTLRIGKKHLKDYPQFVSRIIHTIKSCKSLQHLSFYQFFCKVPSFDRKMNVLFLNLKTQLVVYASGIGSKSQRRFLTYLSHKIVRQIYIASRKSSYLPVRKDIKKENKNNVRQNQKLLEQA